MDVLHRYTVHTLVDVTKTNVVNYNKGQEKQRNQQRNWETVIQLLSLRAQLIYIDYVGSQLANVKDYSFGINYIDQQRVWTFNFAIEHAEVFAVQHDRYGALKQDFRLSPIILGLDETARPNISLFHPSGPDKNIYFIQTKDL